MTNGPHQLALTHDMNLRADVNKLAPQTLAAFVLIEGRPASPGSSPQARRPIEVVHSTRSVIIYNSDEGGWLNENSPQQVRGTSMVDIIVRQAGMGEVPLRLLIDVVKNATPGASLKER